MVYIVISRTHHKFDFKNGIKPVMALKWVTCRTNDREAVGSSSPADKP